jgi:hypothetical protein
MAFLRMLYISSRRRRRSRLSKIRVMADVSAGIHPRRRFQVPDLPVFEMADGYKEKSERGENEFKILYTLYCIKTDCQEKNQGGFSGSIECVEFTEFIELTTF